jgi:hypothetical protein
MVLLLSYDLVGRERPSSYDRVREYIEHHAISSERPLYSQWLIHTDASAGGWRKALKDNALIDDDDRLFICPVVSNYDGWLPKQYWDWLAARI